MCSFLRGNECTEMHREENGVAPSFPVDSSTFGTRFAINADAAEPRRELRWYYYNKAKPLLYSGVRITQGFPTCLKSFFIEEVVFDHCLATLRAPRFGPSSLRVPLDHVRCPSGRVSSGVC